MIKCTTILMLAVSILNCKNIGESKNMDIETTSSDTLNIKISLAQWSFHKALESNKMDHLDFISKAGKLGFDGVEYVNKFFKDKAHDTIYLNKMTEKAKEAGVKQLLIMIDSEGNLGDTNSKKREIAIQNHHKWVDAAAFLGCHSIRVNAGGDGSREDVASAAIDGLSLLAQYASTKNINIIVENHGGYSSDGIWLSGIISKINKPNVGTLPDFGNFCIKNQKDAAGNSKCIEEYDRYKGVEELMPYAKAVSAKSNDFGELGFETKTDYMRMLQIVKDADYKGYIGVEYEGDVLSEEEGVIATKKLIEKCFTQLYPKL